MNRRGWMALAIVLVGASIAAQATPAFAQPTLRSRVVWELRKSTASKISVAVEMEGRGPVISYGGSRWTLPASTQKMYPGLAALVRLGDRSRLVTSVRRTGPVTRGGTLHGDLALVGGGDPTFSSDTLALLARNVARSGIRRVKGSVYGDDSRYDRKPSAPGYFGNYNYLQRAPLSALSLDGIRWWGVRAYRRSPALFTAERFRTMLAAAGVVVEGHSRPGAAPSQEQMLVASHGSPTVATLVQRMMKRSDNLIAEQLLKEVGYSIGDATTAGGLRAIRALADRFGIPADQSADGSGLSRSNRSTPWNQVAWLRAAERTAVSRTFKRSLPVSCAADGGTLGLRMCKTPAAGRVLAKTGNLRGVITLAGYARTNSGKLVRFSFLLSGVRSKQAARAAIDRALVQIVRYGR